MSNADVDVTPAKANITTEGYVKVSGSTFQTVSTIPASDVEGGGSASAGLTFGYASLTSLDTGANEIAGQSGTAYGTATFKVSSDIQQQFTYLSLVYVRILCAVHQMGTVSVFTGFVQYDQDTGVATVPVIVHFEQVEDPPALTAYTATFAFQAV